MRTHLGSADGKSWPSAESLASYGIDLFEKLSNSLAVASLEFSEKDSKKLVSALDEITKSLKGFKEKYEAATAEFIEDFLVSRLKPLLAVKEKTPDWAQLVAVEFSAAASSLKSKATSIDTATATSVIEEMEKALNSAPHVKFLKLARQPYSDDAAKDAEFKKTVEIESGDHEGAKSGLMPAELSLKTAFLPLIASVRPCASPSTASGTTIA